MTKPQFIIFAFCSLSIICGKIGRKESDVQRQILEYLGLKGIFTIGAIRGRMATNTKVSEILIRFGALA